MSPVVWMRARTPIETAALLMLSVLALTALIAPFVMRDAATTTDVAQALQGSSGEHWLGTDDLGRDIFARVLVATRLSLALALGATAIGVTVGVVLGAAALAPRIGSTVTASINVAVAFPGMLSALFFAVIFGAGSASAMASVGLAMAPSFARLMQTLGSTVHDLDYVSAARLLGLTRRRVFLRYVLPNIADPLIVNAAIAAGSSLVVLAALSFLGLGVQSPAYDWGLLLESSLSRIYTSPESALGPGVAICFAGIAFTMAGERAASRFEPKVRARRVARQPEPAGVVAGPDEVASAKNLVVSYLNASGEPQPVVHGVSFAVRRSERVGLVGESGSGKTATALALAGLQTAPAQVTAERLAVGDCAVLGEMNRDRQRALKQRVGMVFQDAARAFNPALRVGTQIAEAGVTGTRAERSQRAVDLLAALKVAAPSMRATQYPHQLSGGTLQRAMTAMAMTAEPQLLIADEPTSALDVTVQSVALRTLNDLLDRTGAALLFISHDIAVLAETCERVLVMYAGHIVEELPVAALREGPAHPYTRALVQMARDLDSDRDGDLVTLPGGPPAPGNAPDGCAFAPRCAAATERCRTERPQLEDVQDQQRAACWHPLLSRTEQT